MKFSAVNANADKPIVDQNRSNGGEQGEYLCGCRIGGSDLSFEGEQGTKAQGLTNYIPLRMLHIRGFISISITIVHVRGHQSPSAAVTRTNGGGRGAAQRSVDALQETKCIANG